MNRTDKEMWELLRADIKELKDRVTLLEDVFNNAKGALWVICRLAGLAGAVSGIVFVVQKIIGK